MNGINVKRVLENLEEIYLCGKQEDGTFGRLAFSAEDVKGRELFLSYFREMGITPTMDAAGNLIARIDGTDNNLPAIVIGSHLDTVPNGGKYDGVLGCVGGLEVCRALREAGKRLRHPLEIIVFTDEEGARFGSGMLGSNAICGDTSEFAAGDMDLMGNTREAVFASYGIHTTDLHKAARQREEMLCFLELHVEQGISLHEENIPIAAVTSIAGVVRYEIVVEGQANHSGSTLMKNRRDALVAAASLIAEIPEIVKQWGEKYTVATVGTIAVEPGAVNVIPGKCTFHLEIRDQNEKLISLIYDKLMEHLGKSCEMCGCIFQSRQVSHHAPAPMADWVRKVIRESCESLAIPCADMPSGAFHDSLIMANVFPTAMIFIPSVGGISHSPLEYSTEDDIEKGCRVLLESVLRLDNM